MRPFLISASSRMLLLGIVVAVLPQACIGMRTRRHEEAKQVQEATANLSNDVTLANESESGHWPHRVLRQFRRGLQGPVAPPRRQLVPDRVQRPPPQVRQGNVRQVLLTRPALGPARRFPTSFAPSMPVRFAQFPNKVGGVRLFSGTPARTTKFSKLKSFGQRIVRQGKNLTAPAKRVWDGFTAKAREVASETMDKLLTKTEGSPFIHKLLTRIKDDANLGKKVVFAIIAFTPLDELLMIWVFSKFVPEKYQNMIYDKFMEVVAMLDPYAEDARAIGDEFLEAQEKIVADDWNMPADMFRAVRAEFPEEIQELDDEIVAQELVGALDADDSQTVWAARVLELCFMNWMWD